MSRLLPSTVGAGHADLRFVKQPVCHHMLVSHGFIRRAVATATISATDHLLAGEFAAAVAPAVAVHRPITLRQKVANFAIQY